MPKVEDITVGISVEECLHKALKETLNKVCEDYGIKVESISAEWIDLSTSDENRAEIKSMTIESRS